VVLLRAELQALQHLALAARAVVGLLIGRLGCLGAGQIGGPEGLKLHRIGTGGSSGLHQPASQGQIAVVIHTGLGDYNSGHPITRLPALITVPAGSCRPSRSIAPLPMKLPGPS